MKTHEEASHAHGDRTSRQLSPKTWPDFERFFAANGGAWGGCWCLFYHKPGHFDSKAYAENKRAKHALVESGDAHGTIVYCGSDPVGWCQFGQKEELRRVDSRKGYAPSSPDPWRITCFFIARGHRQMGFAGFAVSESIRAMRKLGAKDVEAYPVDGRRTASLLWSGTPSLFEGQGFSRAGPFGKNSWVYTLNLGGR